MSIHSNEACENKDGAKCAGFYSVSDFIAGFYSASDFIAQPEIEDWSSWDEDAPTSIKIEGGNGTISPPPNEEEEEPDYFKDMAPTIRKTQKVCPEEASTS